MSRAHNTLAGMLVNDLYRDRRMAWDAGVEEKIAALTPEQINEAMRRHLDPDEILIVKAGDFANKPPVAAPATPTPPEQ
ncbi:hypothetical protein BH20GEM2_BH20GEM2_20330 [soil metagenome]